VLASTPDGVRSPVSVDNFHQFVSALEEKNVEVTNGNIDGLSMLCDEFCFFGLSERLSAFQQSADCKKVAAMDDGPPFHSGVLGGLSATRSVLHISGKRCDTWTQYVSRGCCIGGSAGAALVDVCACTFSLSNVGVLNSL
jgi:hypothetical protein